MACGLSQARRQITTAHLIAFHPLRQAAIVVGKDMFRIESYRLGVVGDGAVEIAGLVPAAPRLL